VERDDWHFIFAGVRGDRSYYTRCPRDSIFSECCFCLGVIPGLFLRDGLVIGLNGRFRSPRIPLGISVEYGVPGNVGLGFGIRAYSAAKSSGSRRLPRKASAIVWERNIPSRIA